MRTATTLLAAALVWAMAAAARSRAGETCEADVGRALNAYYVADADLSAGLISSDELLARHRQLLSAVTRAPTDLLPFLVGANRRSESALAILEEIEGVSHTSKGKEGQTWPDIEAWREHFARKDKLFAERETTRSEVVAAARQTLESFLTALAEGSIDDAYRLVSPASRETGDPVAYRAALDKASFASEVAKVDRRKFAGTEIGPCHARSPTEVIVYLSMSWNRQKDNDRVHLRRENNRWVVINPITVIR